MTSLLLRFRERVKSIPGGSFTLIFGQCDLLLFSLRNWLLSFGKRFSCRIRRLEVRSHGDFRPHLRSELSGIDIFLHDHFKGLCFFLML